MWAPRRLTALRFPTACYRGSFVVVVVMVVLTVGNGELQLSDDGRMSVTNLIGIRPAVLEYKPTDRGQRNMTTIYTLLFRAHRSKSS
jgi:hypothetical protein